MTKVRVYSYPFENVQKFSRIDIDYVTDPAAFGDFISLVPTLSNFGKALANRGLFRSEREVLVEVLKDQYKASGSSQEHFVGLLDADHFTVVTAHQPSLLTGPLYFIYKICSTINLARQLTEANPAYRVHPVFVLGAEDHDFEEINHLHLFGQRFEWSTDQSGPVGRMRVGQGITDGD